MNQLTLGIKRNGHIFNLKLMPFHRFIRYTSKYGDYELTIRFLSDKDKRPSVKYKNLVFTGAITSINKWRIELIDSNGRQDIVSMRKGHLYLRGENSASQIVNVPSSNFSIPFNLERKTLNEQESNNIYQKCIAQHFNEFIQIKNKERFKEQLIDLIADIFFDYETEDELISDSKGYFINFINAEHDCWQLSKLISVSDVLEKFSNLETIIINDLNNFIEDAIEIVVDEYKDEIDIYYTRDGVLSEIYNIISYKIEERNYIQFQNKYAKENNIKKILGDKLLLIKDTALLIQQIQFLIMISEIKGKNDLISKIDALIKQCKDFEMLWEDCKSFNHNKTIELSDEKLIFFEGIDNGVNSVNEEDKQDYLVYKIAMPHYYSTLYNKKRTKLKPTIEKLPHYIDYVKSIVAILINNGILLKKGEKLQYSSNGNMDNCKQEILSIMHKGN